MSWLDVLACGFVILHPFLFLLIEVRHAIWIERYRNGN